MRTEQPVQGDADIAQIGALIGDPARARVLTALTDGRALREARTCYNHLAGRLGVGLLAGLLDGGLLSGGDGRHHPERAVAD